MYSILIREFEMNPWIDIGNNWFITHHRCLLYAIAFELPFKIGEDLEP
jgi:hypothetical protein